MDRWCVLRLRFFAPTDPEVFWWWSGDVLRLWCFASKPTHVQIVASVFTVLRFGRMACWVLGAPQCSVVETMGGGKTEGANILVLHNTDMWSLVSAQERMAKTTVMQWFRNYALVRSWYAGMTSDCVQRHVQRRAEKHEYAFAEEVAAFAQLTVMTATRLKPDLRVLDRVMLGCLTAESSF